MSIIKRKAHGVKPWLSQQGIAWMLECGWLRLALPPACGQGMVGLE